jgi:hypothetical protein
MDTKTKGSPPQDKIDPDTGEVVTEEGSPSGAVTASAGGAVALPDEYDYGADMGAGFENQTSEDVAIPFLNILQPTSPECQVEGSDARPGMIVNKTTGAVISGREGVAFVPAYTEHLLVEWVPRDKGGGIVGRHAIDGDFAKRVRAEQPFGEYRTESGNDLVETFYVYGCALDEEGTDYPAILAFSSTHIRAYKGWMFQARAVVVKLPDGRKLTGLPLFSHGYRMRTEKVEKNGHTWFVPKIGWAGENADASRLVPGSDLYQHARGVKEAIASGAARADTGSLRREGGDEEGVGRRAPASEERAPY